MSYSSFDPTNCREAAYAIAKKLGTTISDSSHRTDIATRNSNGTGNINKEATRNALETMRNSINAGKPFIMGVSKSDGYFCPTIMAIYWMLS